MTDEIFEKIVLMLVAMPGMIAPAATATKPAIQGASDEVLSACVLPDLESQY